MTNTQNPPDARPLFVSALDQLSLLMNDVTPADLDRPTPCEGWAVRDLLAHLEPGVRLWRRGDPADHMFLVVSGAVTCTAEDGRTFRYGPGTAVGGLEALADKTRWYEPVTEAHTVGLRGRSDHLMDLFENYFSMAMDFVSSLARAQIGILARRTALGQRPLAVARDVSNLGAVKVGA